MGQRLSAASPNASQPGTFFLRMVLKCDTAALCCIETEYLGDDYQKMRKEAYNAGWRRKPSCWVGPCCGRLKGQGPELFD